MVTRSQAATSGLVAYLDGEPVGWCAVEPRTAYPRLLLKTRVPWEGRAEDKTDDSVWAVTCFVTRAGFRRRGISRALARAAVDFARERGARALEGYPMITQPGQEITLGRAPCRQPQHLRRRRVHGGQPADPAPGRDANRLLGDAVYAAPMDEPVVVKVVGDETEAEIVCGLLRSAGIECAYRDTDRIDTPLEDFTASGQREILVHPSDLEAARALLGDEA